MIEFKNVNKSFGENQAIKDITFKINQGEKFVLLGTSGSGKSTILKHINALLKSDEGTININDQNIDSLDVIKLRRNTGYVIQEGGLFPHYTVKQNVEIIPILNKTKSSSGISERTKELLTSLKLNTNILEKYPSELSGGQMQRVGIARALAGDPDLLLFDEPLSALDPITKSHILNDFISLPEYKTKTIIWVTHDLNEAVKVGTAICVLHEGTVQQIATPTEILLNPSNNFVKTFFAGEKLQYLINTISIGDLVHNLEPTGVIGNEKKPSEKFKLTDSVKLFLNSYNNKSIVSIEGSAGKNTLFNSNILLSRLFELSTTD